MKALVKSVLLTATVGLFFVPASASPILELSSIATQDTIVKDTITADTLKKEVPMYFAQEEVTYAKIEVSDLPEAVKKGVTENYTDYVIEEAQKGSDNSYKLIIKKGEDKQTIVLNEKGEAKEKSEAKTGTILV